jgi:hypothetical protein
MAGTSVFRHWPAPGAALLLPFALAAPCWSQEERSPAAELNTVLFASLDGMRPGYASAGFKRTLEGSLDRSGPATLLSTGFGREPVSGARGFRHKAAASALVGWQWLLPSITLSGFVGPELEYERESAASGQRQRPQGGVRARPSCGRTRPPRRF